MASERAARRPIERIGLPRIRFTVVLLLLLGLVVGLVMLGGTDNSPRLRNITAVSLLLIAIPAAAGKTRHRRVAVVLAVLAALSNGSSLFGIAPLSLELGPLMSAVFAGYATLLLLAKVVSSRRVTGDVLAGALASYLLSGLTFATIYGLAGAGTPAAFAAPGGQPASFADLVYFSFVTLFTVGFGDITPVSPGARAIFLLEGLFGIVFTTIVMASLVAAYLGQRKGQALEGGE